MLKLSSIRFENFLNKAKLIHNNKYDYSLVEYINAKHKVKIICNNHEKLFIFEQTPDNHLSGRGCYKCSNNLKLSTLDFITKSNIIHNYKYDYSLSNYINNSIKVKIICKNHNEIFIFEQTPANHLSKRGCPKCAGKIKYINDFIDLSNKVHNNKYDYSLVIYKNTFTKIKIICNDHLELFIFEQIPNDHSQGKGCPKCGGKEKSNTQDFIKKSNIIHNYKYDYYLVNYINNRNKVKIKCNNHKAPFIFKQSPEKHLFGRGCPKCSHTISKLETKWLDSLNIKTENRQLSLIGISQKIKVDGYDPETNTVYEFYGDYYHGNPKIYKLEEYNKKVKKTFGELYRKTIEKESMIKNTGYNLVTKWET